MAARQEARAITRACGAIPTADGGYCAYYNSNAYRGYVRDKQDAYQRWGQNSKAPHNSPHAFRRTTAAGAGNWQWWGSGWGERTEDGRAAFRKGVGSSVNDECRPI